MEETLAPITFLNKTFIFLEKKDNKIKFKYENQETSELCILELIYSEKEKMLTKVDLYISINNEIEESLHIRKETKDSYELSYFPSNNQRVKVNKEMINKVIDCFPTKNYIYDREYELVGINENAIVYRNMEDDLMEIEIYLDDNLSKVKELRFISYNKNKFLTEGVRKKFSIIRAIPQDDKTVYSSLCSRKEGSMLINGATHSKCNISAEAIISEENHAITDMNLKLFGKFGVIELKQSPINHREFIDKNDIYYHISSVTYGTYRMLILIAPGIINKFNSFLVEGKEESKAIQLVKKEDTSNI